MGDGVSRRGDLATLYSLCSACGGRCVCWSLFIGPTELADAPLAAPALRLPQYHSTPSTTCLTAYMAAMWEGLTT
ncbi:hypothetical protein Cob_v009861 [Colletotrichum orbiculare MAFF 240422]|uniref:Uncharacterized protein n=1 Tax=Colletotrichum orbiculare (strain 104-T / ATCC 96160 / CBS 514.97 / LARS 414 / MAFF 240422) TaxID=1213857 RepID=A0A484FHW6_COLOR|nr:hypothetical protein Cob_v009861 [Colletotrichum orbiculare MAFF 240422]